MKKLYNYLRTILLLLCVMAMVKPSIYGQTVFPDDAWGVHTSGDYNPIDDNPTKCPHIRGAPLKLTWRSLEPRNGKFEFQKQIWDKLEDLDASDYYAYIKVWVAPATTAVTETDTTWAFTPKWIFDNGVPLVEFPQTINPLGQSTTRYFPYYLDEDYKFFFHRMIDSLGNYICNLPPHLKKRILFVQSAEGSTGDGQPYKGSPVDPYYNITNKQWADFRLETWNKYKEALTKDGKMQFPLATNSDSNNEEHNNWMLNELLYALGVKNGMFSHGYQISNAQERVASHIDFRNQVESMGKTFFARGEQDGEWKTYGWSKQNPKQGFYWTSIYATHCGLWMWNLPSEVCMGETYADAINFFNKYAAQTSPQTAKGAFCAFYRGLDASNVNEFPVVPYGEASKSNQQRYINICNAFSEYGARMGDVEKATGAGMENRKAEDYNDAGWKILKTNLQRHITQMDAETTSDAWWQVDATIYGRYARGFNPAVPAKNNMYFDLDDKFFGDSPLYGSQTIGIAITYRDSDPGSWELKYDATDGTMKTAMTVTNSGSGSNVWKTKMINISDAYLGNRGDKGADFILVNTGGTNCRFHMIAVDKGGFAVRNINLSVANPLEGIVSGGGELFEGKIVTVTANGADDYRFVHWTENGIVVSTNSDYTFIVSADRHLVAHFEYFDRNKTIIETPGAGTWIVPQGVTSATIQAWGGGGSGGSAFGNGTTNVTGTTAHHARGGGGAGAGFAAATIAVSPGQGFYYVVGAGGVAPAPSSINTHNELFTTQHGGNTTFSYNSSIKVLAQGGLGGGNALNTEGLIGIGGAGATAYSEGNIGDEGSVFYGGNGWTWIAGWSGSGGGSAGAEGHGGDAASQAGGLAGAGGGATGGAGNTLGSNGNAGLAPGGGGAGAHARYGSVGARTGGNGGNGMLIINANPASSITRALEGTAISVYPNPTTDKLYVNSYGMDIHKIQLIDLVGKVVYTHNVVNENESIDLNGMISGLYIVKVHLFDSFYITKVRVK